MYLEVRSMLGIFVEAEFVFSSCALLFEFLIDIDEFIWILIALETLNTFLSTFLDPNVPFIYSTMPQFYLFDVFFLCYSYNMQNLLSRYKDGLTPVFIELNICSKKRIMYAIQSSQDILTLKRKR
ncbi:hypothetical protein ACJX0J_013507 [Zea mays]